MLTILFSSASRVVDARLPKTPWMDGDIPTKQGAKVGGPRCNGPADKNKRKWTIINIHDRLEKQADMGFFGGKSHSTSRGNILFGALERFLQNSE